MPEAESILSLEVGFIKKVYTELKKQKKRGLARHTWVSVNYQIEWTRVT